MAVGYGRDSWASVLSEATYGTTPAGTESYFRIIEATDGMDRAVKISPSLQGATPKNTFLGNKNVKKQIKAEMLYQGLNQFLRHALGTYTYSVDTPVASANTHGFLTADSLLTGLSVEVCEANIPSGKVFMYTGCKVAAFEMAFETDEPVILTVDLIAQNETPNTTASGTPSYPAYHPVLWSHAGTLTLAGTASLEFTKGHIRVDNMLKERHLMHDSTREPMRDGMRKISGEFTIEFEDLTLYTKFITPTTGALALTYTSTEMVTGSTPYTMGIAMAKVQLEKPKIDITSTGIVEVTYPFISLYNASAADQLTLTIVNGETTLA